MYIYTQAHTPKGMALRADLGPMSPLAHHTPRPFTMRLLWAKGHDCEFSSEFDEVLVLALGLRPKAIVSIILVSDPSIMLVIGKRSSARERERVWETREKESMRARERKK